MPNVTFRHPERRDHTVYAVAGSHLEPILKIARRNNIPINFDCQDGRCGNCLVRVTSLHPHGWKAGPLTEREQQVLLELGKITQEEVQRMAVDDLPTQWRLACQMVVRDEDLIVEYEVA
ncbi:MAG: 2Fe-2S iron-sulfur cluster-binding protein [Halorhodospira sp.]